MKKSIDCLIIDDDPDDQDIFLMCVKDTGMHVDCRTASDCEEALTMLESQQEYVPNYIFLDVNMPKMNGLDCLRQLKKMGQLTKTKIFMYSTTSETATVEKSKDLGANDFIVKPAQTAVLKEKLSQIFKHDPNVGVDE